MSEAALGADSFWGLIEARAAATPDALLGVDEHDRRMTFGEYRDACERTAAGLAVGCAIAGIDARLHAVRVVEKVLCNAMTLGLLIHRTRKLLRGLGAQAPAAHSWRVIDDQAGACYGHVTRRGREAIDLLAIDGLRLEPTYSAKAMAALIAHLRRRGGREPVLFWHTASAWDTRAWVVPDAMPRLAPAIRRWLETTDDLP